MVQLGQLVQQFKYNKRSLAGCGIQTAALAFGGEQTPAFGQL
jgi:hypothetical protein